MSREDPDYTHDDPDEEPATVIPPCECGQPGLAAHTCPYASEIHDDDVTLCFCCAACAERCAEDV